MFRFPDDYVYIPSGDYRVGMDEDAIEEILARYPGQTKSEYLYTCFPGHAVRLRGYHVSKSLVTATLFGDFVRETNYLSDAEKEGWGWTWQDGWKKQAGLNWKAPFGTRLDAIYRENSDVVPVMQASWYDAQFFCRWMSEKTCRRVRIPGESEWETWTATDSKLGYTSIPGRAGSVDEFFMQTIEILGKNTGVFPRGMIWEWTDDWFDMYPGGVKNRDFGTTYKVLRGGSLMSGDIQRRKEYRFRRCPTARSPFYGFRICSDPR